MNDIKNEYMYKKDTIWATQVVITARKERNEPRKLSCRSVMVAIPTPKRRIPRENFMLLLQLSQPKTNIRDRTDQ